MGFLGCFHANCKLPGTRIQFKMKHNSEYVTQVGKNRLGCQHMFHKEQI